LATPQREKMGPRGFEPRTDRLCIPLQLSLPLSSLWAGLSLHPVGCLPSSLYTFPSRKPGLGSGLPYPQI